MTGESFFSIILALPKQGDKREMKKIEVFALAGICTALNAWALPADGLHPNSDAWAELFAQDLSNAEDTKGVWFRDAEGNLTASKDVLLIRHIVEDGHGGRFFDEIDFHQRLIVPFCKLLNDKSLSHLPCAGHK